MDITNIIYTVPELILWAIVSICLILPLATKNFLNNRVFSYLLLPIVATLGMFWNSVFYWYLVIGVVIIVGLFIRSAWCILSSLLAAITAIVFHVYAAPEKLQTSLATKDYDRCCKILHLESVNKNQLTINDLRTFERFPDTIVSYNSFIDGSIIAINKILADNPQNQDFFLSNIMKDWVKLLVLEKQPTEKGYNQYNNIACIYNSYADRLNHLGIEKLTYYWDGASFKGKLIKGKRVGYGYMVYSDSSTYNGYWNNDVRSGEGTYKCSDFTYTGNWNNDKPDGKGIKTWHNKNVYDGFFKNGERYGEGILKYASGSIYSGNWISDKYHGKGTYKSSKFTYVGEWKNGLRSGFGTETKSDGSTYSGNWEDDKYHGKGTYKSTESTYVGDWKKGLKNGFGTETNSDGSTYAGSWDSNKYHGQGTYKSKYVSYTGNWEHGEKSGTGAMKYEDGAIYNGEWEHDSRMGKGVMKYADGSTYTGEWVNDIRQGEGQLVTADGKTITGNWVDDSCGEPVENEKKSDFSWGKAILGLGTAALMILF